MENSDFLKIQQESMKIRGFWDEQAKSVILSSIESLYSSEVIRNWYISDMVIRDSNRILIKWEKRFIPLSDQEIEGKYRIG